MNRSRAADQTTTVKVSVSALQSKLSRSLQSLSRAASTWPAKTSTRSALPANRRVQESVSRFRAKTTSARKPSQISRQRVAPRWNEAAANPQSKNALSNLVWSQRRGNNRPFAETGSGHPTTARPTLIRRLLNRLSGVAANRPSTATPALHTPGAAEHHHIAPEPVRPGRRGFNTQPNAGNSRRTTVLDKSALQPLIPLDIGNQSRTTLQRQQGSNRASTDGTKRAPFAERLQSAVSRVSPSDHQTIGSATNAAHEVEGWRELLNTEPAPRLHQGHRPTVDDAEMVNPEWSEPSPQQPLDAQQLEMPMADPLSGWPLVTHGIADARINNVPKQPLRPIR